jgi:hypothetical protein
LASRYGLLLILIGVFLAAGDYASSSAQCISGGRYNVTTYCGTGYFYLGWALAALGAVIVFGRRVIMALRKPAAAGTGTLTSISPLKD